MSTSDDISQPGFEDSLAELEAIVHELEEGQLGLSQALARYEQGVKHLKNCYHLLQQAEQKIELLVGVSEDGAPVTQPFVGEPTEASPESTGRRRRSKSSPAGTSPADATVGPDPA